MTTCKHIQDSKSKTKSTPKRKDISNCRALRPNRKDTTPNEIAKQQKKKSPTSLSFTKTGILAAKHCRLLPLRLKPSAAELTRIATWISISRANIGKKCATLTSLSRKEMHSVKGAKTGYMLTLGTQNFVSFFSSLSNLTKNNLLWVHLDIC